MSNRPRTPEAPPRRAPATPPTIFIAFARRPGSRRRRCCDSHHSDGDGGEAVEQRHHRPPVHRGEELARARHRSSARRFRRIDAAAGIGGRGAQERRRASSARRRRSAHRRRRSAARSPGRRCAATGSGPSWNMNALTPRRPSSPAAAQSIVDRLLHGVADIDERLDGRCSSPRCGRGAARGRSASGRRGSRSASSAPSARSASIDPVRGPALVEAAEIDELDGEPADLRRRLEHLAPGPCRRGPRSAGGSWWRRARRRAAPRASAGRARADLPRRGDEGVDRRRRRGDGRRPGVSALERSFLSVMRDHARAHFVLAGAACNSARRRRRGAQCSVRRRRGATRLLPGPDGDGR